MSKVTKMFNLEEHETNVIKSVCRIKVTISNTMKKIALKQL